jgi:hypothetical protein
MSRKFSSIGRWISVIDGIGKLHSWLDAASLSTSSFAVITLRSATFSTLAHVIRTSFVFLCAIGAAMPVVGIWQMIGSMAPLAMFTTGISHLVLLIEVPGCCSCYGELAD